MPEDSSEPEIYVSYPDSLGRNHVPLVIDNGSYMCRVGWANQKEPNLQFRNVIARNRGKRDLETQVGNDIKNVDALRWLLKSQFDRNVVTQFDIQEIIFDYVFSHLSINTDGSIEHPIVLTEALCNPNYSRQMMSELLFECYQVPSLAYGVDALFSWNQFVHNNKKCSGLIVSLGHTSSHVIPVLDGIMDSQGSQRLSVGGFLMSSYLHRLLQLKYPSHYAVLSLTKAEKLLHLYSYYSKDYMDEIKQWTLAEYYSKNVCKIQLPYSQMSGILPGSNIMCGKIERCQALVERLKDSQLKRRLQNLASDEERLQQLNTVLEIYEESDFDLFQRALSEFGFQTVEDLRLGIHKCSQHVQKLRFTLATGDNRFMPELWELGPSSDPDSWIANVRKKWEKYRDANLLKLNSGKQYDYDRRLQENDDVDILDDDDNHKDMDEFEEQERLRDYEECLREYENEFNKGEDHENETSFGIAGYYQLLLGVERMRCPEVLFQPSLLGLEQAGLAEVVQNVLSRYRADQQNNIVQNVYVTGGCASIPGLVDRMNTEMLQMRPFKSSFKITLSGNPSLDAWYGARAWASHGENVRMFSVSRSEFEEKGGDYLKEHSTSNHFYPTVPRRSQTGALS